MTDATYTVDTFVTPILWQTGSTIDLPRDASILSAQLRFDCLQVCAVFDENLPSETKRFRFHFNGDRIAGNLQYISTVSAGDLSVHVFMEL